MNKVRILVVEDSPIVSTYVARVLEMNGYEVAAKLASGEEAILFLEENQVDLVIMDIMLEGKLTGIETVANFRKHHPVPVIYLTALSDLATLELAARTGPYGFVVKPFDEQDLVNRVEITVRKYQSERQSQQKTLEALVAEFEADNTRIAHELHDGLLQRLSLLQRGMESAHVALELVRQVQDLQLEVKQLIKGVLPGLVRDFPIEVIVQNFCQEYRKIGWNVELIVASKLPALSSDFKLALYRILQESFRNIATHAETTHVVVQVFASDRMLSLSIEDDGKGFDHAGEHTGLGLRNMEARAIICGGTFMVDTKPGEGTFINVTLPLSV